MTIRIPCALHGHHNLTGPQATWVIAALWAVCDDLYDDAGQGLRRDLRQCVQEVHEWARSTEMYYEYVESALHLGELSDAERDAGHEAVR